MKNTRIEAILPLSYMQQGLLFHHLSSKSDQGFLHVECTITGDMDKQIWERAWNSMSKRHSVMRTSIRWEGLDKPLQIIQAERGIDFEYMDWYSYTDIEIANKLDSLKIDIKKNGAPLQKGALATLYLIYVAEKRYILLWPSHHILIDGWSSHIIINDTINTYNSLYQGKEIVLETLPSQKAYLNWVKIQEEQPAKEFWSKRFDNFTTANFFNTNQQESLAVIPEIIKTKLAPDESDSLTAYAREIKVTKNTIVQGAWALLLSHYFKSRDIVIGTTVSGRSGDFPNIHLMSGMFMNIQPVRVQISENKPLQQWLVQLQTQQQEARNYEHMSLDEITASFAWPPGRPLFDNLLIFENYPVANPSTGALRITEMRSGLTSTFPVTLVSIPGDAIAFSLTYLPNIVDKAIAEWLVISLGVIIKVLVIEKTQDYHELLSKLEPPSLPVNTAYPNSRQNQEAYVAPKNEVELKLVQIWESVFGTSPIGVNDNFFELGGKSLMAIRMFATINKKLGWKLSPTSILEHPTITALAHFKSTSGPQPGIAWKNLVPIRASGTKNPLFCLHAGGGHVFFYSPLARHMNSDRPVYGLQPSGIFGKDKMHESIEEMARDYVAEIRKVQPEGPYNLLVYCFSTALGLEMANLFSEAQQESNLIVMDTMTDQDQLLTKQRFSMRLKGFLKRLSKNPLRVFHSMISDRIDTHIAPLLRAWFGNREVKNSENIRRHLQKLYNNYTWITYKGEIKLILTTKAHDSFNAELVRSWNEVAMGGVKTEYTQGNHRSIFEEPEVTHAARAVEKCCV